MARVLSAEELYKILKLHMNLPERCKSIVIKLDANEIPMVTVEHYIEEADLIDQKNLKLVQSTFKLELVDEEEGGGV